VAAAAQGRYVQQPVEWGANWAAVGGKVEVDTIGRLDVLNEAGRAAKGDVRRGLWEVYSFWGAVAPAFASACVRGVFAIRACVCVCVRVRARVSCALVRLPAHVPAHVR
jgi:hypothetical protein